MSTTRFETTTTNAYARRFLPADESIPFRLVGTYEYDQSLNELSKLVQESTEEQIVVYNEMLSVRPEFSFVSGVEMSGLKGQMPAAAATSGQSSSSAGSKQREWLDPFKRRGLAWMMALAKIELGATMSMYGKSKLPFTAYPPTPFDIEPFMHIMLDDLVTHISKLSTDTGFQFVLKSTQIDSWTLAYLRRIKLIRDMANVLYELNDPVITEQLLPYDKELSKYQEGLVARVIIAEIGSSNTSSRFRDVQNQMRTIGACKDLAKDLQSGSPSSGSTGSLSGSGNLKGSVD